MEMNKDVILVGAFLACYSAFVLSTIWLVWAPKVKMLTLK